MEDGAFESRNALCYEIARRASHDENDYSRDEVLAFLRDFEPVRGIPHGELESAVTSAFDH